MKREEFNDILIALWSEVDREAERIFGGKAEMGDCLFVARLMRDGLRDMGLDATGYHGKLGVYPHWFVVAEVEVDNADEAFVVDPLGKAYYPECKVSGDPKDEHLDAEYHALQKMIGLGVDIRRYGLDMEYQKECARLLKGS